MKKILLLMALVSFTFMNAQIWSDDFNDNDISDWTLIDSDGDTHNWSLVEVVAGTDYKMLSQSYDNTNGAYTPDNWLISPAIDLSGETTVILNWLVMASDADWDVENYTVYVATGNTIADFTASTTTFNESTLDGVNTLTPRDLDISAFAGQSTVYIAFRHHNVTDQFQMSIDNVIVDTSVVSYVAPDAAVNPTPADNATNVALDTADNNADGNPDMSVILDWDADTTGTGGAPTSYDIYIGDSASTLTFATNFASGPITWSGRAYSTTYFWKIVAKNAGGEAVGSSTWSFTTEADPAAASIKDNELASQVSIYPTSTKNNFTINNKSNTALTSVSLFDVNGRVVLTQSLENLIGEKSINVSNLSTGMYFVQLNTANATVTKKLIKK